jgi:hypothetical protein
MTAQSRAVAVALVNLARARRGTGANRGAIGSGDGSVQGVDPDLLDALREAQGRGASPDESD